MLYVIGLGLSDEKDITVRGLEVCLLLVPVRFCWTAGYPAVGVCRSLRHSHMDEQVDVPATPGQWQVDRRQ